MPQEIRGVLFDLDGTLYYQAPVRILMAFSLVFLNIMKPRFFVRVMKVVVAYRKAQEALRRNDKMDANGYEAQIRLTSEMTGESAHFVRSQIRKWFERMPLRFLSVFRRRRLVQVLESIRLKGISLGVVSDYPSEKKLLTLGIRQCFEVVVTAQDPDIWGFKPFTNSFQVAAQRMGLPPREIVVVGDRPDADARGAEQAGMRAVILKSMFSKARCDHGEPYGSVCRLTDLPGYIDRSKGCAG